MNKVVLQAKSKEDAIKKAEENLNASRNEFIYTIVEEKGHLFKGNVYTINACTYEQLLSDLELYLKEIVTNMGLDVMIASNYKDNILNINMSSNNNQILIGKNGKTLKALEVLLKQKIFEDYKNYISINLDVEDYKEKRIKNLERLAIKVAKEVRTTKIEVKLDNMNSYERRIIHNKLTDFKGVKTISEGEEPERHVIIKPTD